MIVTGATGFIGQNLVDRLLGEGFEVIGVTRDSSRSERDRRARLTWISWAQASAESLHGADSLVHLATEYGKCASAADVFEANVVQPLRLFAMAASAGVSAFLNTGTYFSKADASYPYLQDYRASKQVFAESARRLLAPFTRSRLVDMQLEHPYGPNEPSEKFCAHVFDGFIGNVKTFECTAGEQQRDFIHVDDVSGAYLAVLHSVDRLKAHQLLEVGTGRASTLKYFVEEVSRATKSSTVANFGALPYRAGEIMYSVADPTALMRLGWRPRFDLASGLRHCIALRATHRAGPDEVKRTAI